MSDEQHQTGDGLKSLAGFALGVAFFISLLCFWHELFVKFFGPYYGPRLFWSVLGGLLLYVVIYSTVIVHNDAVANERRQQEMQQEADERYERQQQYYRRYR